MKTDGADDTDFILKGDYSQSNLAGDDIDKIKRNLKRHGTYDIQKEWR
jgi:hypothetical protein